MKDYSVDNIIKKDALTNTLIYCSLFISLYESMTDWVEDSISGLYCDESTFKNKKIVYTKSKKYVEEIENTIVDSKGNKNKTLASMLWFVKQGCITKDDYEFFLEVKKQRNDYAHEMGNIFLQGTNEKDIIYINKVFALYKKMCLWWWNTFEKELYENYIPEHEIKEVYPVIIQYFTQIFSTMGIIKTQ